MNTRSLRTVLLISSLTCAILLWLTGREWMPSMSAYALSENALYYRLMHLSASWFFLLDGAAYKRNLSYITGFLMGMVLAFDMYNYPFLHDLFTCSVLICTALQLFHYSKRSKKTITAILCVGAVGSFIFGYFFLPPYLFLAEVVTMMCIIIGKLKETWNPVVITT